MDFLQYYLASLAVIWVCVTLLWLLSLAIKDASIVDIFWGSGFVIVAWSHFVQLGYVSPRQVLFLLMITLWGGRLSLYLAKRNLGKGEDFRYANWRKQYGARWWWRSYTKVFIVQGVIMWLVSAPTLGAQMLLSGTELNLLDGVGFLIWLVGFIFEAVGDWQLMVFKANPANKGQVLDSGLWKYTRHPNYFGDAVQWWGFYVVALVNGAWWTLYSPIIMSFFLMRVSGVPMLERTLKETKPQYAEYIRRTSAFIPRQPLD